MQFKYKKTRRSGLYHMYLCPYHRGAVHVHLMLYTQSIFYCKINKFGDFGGTTMTKITVIHVCEIVRTIESKNGLNCPVWQVVMCRRNNHFIFSDTKL